MIQPIEVFRIEKNEIYTKYPCHIVINEQDYDVKSFIETATTFQIPGILEFYFEDFKDVCRIVINYPVEINKTVRIDRENHTYTIYYEPNELVISKDYHSEGTDIGMITKLIQGHVKFIKDPKVLLNILMDTLGGIDLVYLELIISNMFRVEGNETELCRLRGDYNSSTIVGVSQQPFVDSWKSALAFQHIEKAIQNGLVRQQPLKQNPIENVLEEQFDNL